MRQYTALDIELDDTIQYGKVWYRVLDIHLHKTDPKLDCVLITLRTGNCKWVRITHITNHHPGKSLATAPTDPASKSR